MPAIARTIVAKACSSVSNPRASTATSFNPNGWATPFIDSSRAGLSAPSGFHSMPTRVRLGRVSFNNPSRLACISPSLPPSRLKPVTFPPGRARLATNPSLTGSPLLLMTIGMVEVAFMAAAVVRLLPETIVHPEPNQVCCKRGYLLHLAIGEAVLDDDILADVITETSQAVLESSNEMKLRLPRPTREVAHPIDLPCRLLRARGQRQWPCQRGAGDNLDELPPPHSITSSARASRDEGTEISSCFAVRRLTASQKLVGNLSASRGSCRPEEFSLRSTPHGDNTNEDRHRS